MKDRRCNLLNADRASGLLRIESGVTVARALPFFAACILKNAAGKGVYVGYNRKKSRVTASILALEFFGNINIKKDPLPATQPLHGRGERGIWDKADLRKMICPQGSRTLF